MCSLVGATMMTVSSCKKKEGCTDSAAENYDPDAKVDDGSCVDPEPTEAEAPTDPQPQPAGADAVLIGLKSSSEVQGFTVEIGTPVAVFLDGSNFKDVGAVTCETKELTKNSNNSYTYIPDPQNDPADAFGVSYSGTIDWTVEGGNGFPALTKSADGTFPSGLTLTVANGDAISVDGAFTLETSSNISNADSVYFSVIGPSGNVMSRQHGSVSSYTFTADEMAEIGKGSGYVQVAAYRISETETLGSGEVVYYLNENVNTVAVTFE